jgi:hypothetical protein
MIPSNWPLLGSDLYDQGRGQNEPPAGALRLRDGGWGKVGRGDLSVAGVRGSPGGRSKRRCHQWLIASRLMGFFGSFVVARCDGPLAELPAMRQAGGDLSWSAQDGAWQILQLHGGGRPAGSIVQDTQAPVLVAHVFDSDVVTVEATSPQGPGWTARRRIDSAHAPCRGRKMTCEDGQAAVMRAGRYVVAGSRRGA